MASETAHNLRHHPLDEVALVINFPPEASVECLRHEFFDRIRPVYSQLIPPELHQGIPPAFEPYRFDQEDGSAAIMLGLNSLGYVTYKYSDYEGFRRECLRLIGITEKTFAISRLTRVGLRYTIIIPFTRKNGKVPLEKFIRVGLKLPREIPTNLDGLSIGFVVPVQDAAIHVRVEPRTKRDDPNEEAIFLVLSYERTGVLAMKSFPDYLDGAHSEARKLFKSLVLDSYRRSLKKEGDGV